MEMYFVTSSVQFKMDYSSPVFAIWKLSLFTGFISFNKFVKRELIAVEIIKLTIYRAEIHPCLFHSRFNLKYSVTLDLYVWRITGRPPYNTVR